MKLLQQMAGWSAQRARLPMPASALPASDELAHLRAVQATRTPEGIANARRLGRDGILQAWLGEARVVRAGSASRLRGLAATGAMLASMSAAAIAGGVAKAAHARPRPWRLDPTLELALRHRPAGSSFPSGHSAIAHAAARSLQHFADPEHGARLARLADAVADSRIYVGAHVPSDVQAGAEIGRRVATAVSGVVARTLPGG